MYANGQNKILGQYLHEAVVEGNLKYLQHIITQGSDAIPIDINGNTVLHVAIICERPLIFNYLLSLKDFDLNFKNNNDETPLILALTRKKGEYALKLIQKGANIHLGNSWNHTPFHYAILEDSLLDIAEILIKLGVDINKQDDIGSTPLHFAARCGINHAVHMLMYYGADPLIYDSQNNIPITTYLNNITRNRDLKLIDILFDYTFGNDCKIHLNVFTKMINFEKLFQKLIERTSEITYDQWDLTLFSVELNQLSFSSFKLFFHKFSYVVIDILGEVAFLNDYFKFARDLSKSAITCMEILEFLFENISNFKSMQDMYPQEITVVDLILLNRFNAASVRNMSTESLESLICFFLSYGLNVSKYDLYVTFQECPNRSLFKLLLSMDVKTDDSIPDAHSFILPRLACDVDSDIDMILENIDIKTVNRYDLCYSLNFFNHPKLKHLVKEIATREELFRLDKMPKLPRLLELARNVTRRYIIDRLQIHSCKEYYSCLRRLKIAQYYKQILLFEVKLYDFCDYKRV